MTRAQIIAGMAIMEAAVGGSYDECQFDVWRTLLSDIDPDAYLAACKRAAIEQEFPVLPTVGLIRRLATEATLGVAITPEEAFAQVRQAMSRFGFYEPTKAEAALGPAIWSVVRGIGGWYSLCTSSTDDRSSLFAQFRDAWLRLSQRAAAESRLPMELRPRIGFAGPVKALAESIGEKTKKITQKTDRAS